MLVECLMETCVSILDFFVQVLPTKKYKLSTSKWGGRTSRTYRRAPEYRKKAPLHLALNRRRHMRNKTTLKHSSIPQIYNTPFLGVNKNQPGQDYGQGKRGAFEQTSGQKVASKVSAGGACAVSGLKKKLRGGRERHCQLKPLHGHANNADDR